MKLNSNKWKTWLLFAGLFIFIVGTAAEAEATEFRWTDGNGLRVIADQPAQKSRFKRTKRAKRGTKKKATRKVSKKRTTKPVVAVPESQGAFVIESDIAPVALDLAETEAGTCEACNNNTFNPLASLDQIPLPEANPRRSEMKAEMDAQAARGKSLVQRLTAASLKAAGKCRKSARFKGGRWMCGDSVSKGLCATGVREAMEEAGIPWGRGHGSAQGARLARHHMFERFTGPMEKAPVGSVLTCGGGKHGYGHVEIVVHDKKRGRLYCSDFCTSRPVCNARRYHSRVAYKLKGV